MIKVFIADDHNLFREGIITILSKAKDIKVVGEAEDGLELISKYSEAEPDIILSDISMPGKSGPDSVRLITNKDKEIKVLFLSQYTGDDYIYSVLQARGSGLISKNALMDDLLLAIRTVASGGKYFVGKSESELEAIINRFSLIKKKEKRENVNGLTKKEEEILLLVSENLSSKEIADKLKLSIRTVDSHRLSIISKFQLKSLPGLISFAQEYARKIKEK
ncbi:MAG: response regulator transcription factor [Ignavibacteriae bacterium]|nr:response regulator transcription factor [Ignavibacteriota bacterium]